MRFRGSPGLLCIVLAAVLAARAPAGEIGAESEGAGEPRAAVGLTFQFGYGRLVAGPRLDDSDTKSLFSWELAVARWDGRSTGWGVGVRSLVDDLGFRLGPKAFLRFPLRSRVRSHVQFGLAWYLFKGDGGLEDRPGWSYELEVAPGKAISAVLTWENVRYSEQIGARQTDAGERPIWRPVRETRMFAGLKLNQNPGLIVAAFILGIAAVFAAGY